MQWSTGFKCAFRDIVTSPVWKCDAREFSHEEHLQRSKCFRESKPNVSHSIEKHRTEQDELFFMTQLPGELAFLSPYNEDPVVMGPAVVNIQQTLLKIINMEIHIKLALHGQCTVVRMDLEWYVDLIHPENILLTSRSGSAHRFLMVRS